MIILFFHVLGAIGMGFYLLLPFLLQKVFIQKRSVLHVLYRANFVTQWILVAQLLTGGYLYTQGEYSARWTVFIAITYVAIGAFGGLFGYQIRHFLKSPSQYELEPWMRKIRFLAVLTTVSFFMIIVLMLFPHGV
jgi:H+/Cl- antiporter ClcA